MFEKFNKIDKPRIKLINKKKERKYKLLYQKWKRAYHYCTFLTDIKKSVKEYYEHFYTNKFNNLDACTN